jgi:hypothetical protein
MRVHQFYQLFCEYRLVGWFYGVYRHFHQYFIYIVAVSFIGGGNWRTGENLKPAASH